jgi:hypothetical protein
MQRRFAPIPPTALVNRSIRADPSARTSSDALTAPLSRPRFARGPAQNSGGSYTKAARRDNSVRPAPTRCGKPPHSRETAGKPALSGDAAFRRRHAATIFPNQADDIPYPEPK